MALTLPSAADLTLHREGVSDEVALQRAADLFSIATGLTETPTDPMEARLVQVAILDMAWYLQATHEDREAAFSPFSSERIGSYSYNKAAAAVDSKTKTGVPGFDAAVEHFSTRNYATIDSEWVFAPGYTEDKKTTGFQVGGRAVPTLWEPDTSGEEILFDADGFPIVHPD